MDTHNRGHPLDMLPSEGGRAASRERRRKG